MHFADSLISIIAEMANEVRRHGLVSGALNYTFLVLIPKKIGATSLSDYRPISLYNTLYKIISKTIAERIKEVLACYISPEQSGFLKGR